MTFGLRSLFRTAQRAALRCKSFLVPVWNKPTDYVIEHAFSIGGVDYFHYVDYINMPVERAREMSHVYQELDLKVDRQLLLAHTNDVDKELTKISDGLIIRDGTLNPNQIIKAVERLRLLNTDIQKRTEFISEPDMIYKLASVVYFDKNENPRVYDEEYNQKKIAHWKKFRMKDFFLTVPLQKLLPHIDFSKIDLETFTHANQAVGAMTIKLLDSYLGSPNSTGLTGTLRNDLILRRDQLIKSLQSEGLQYSNIIASLSAE